MQGDGTAASAKPPIASDSKAEEFCGNILRYHKVPDSKSNPLERGQEVAVLGSSRSSENTAGTQLRLLPSLSGNRSNDGFKVGVRKLH